MSVSGTTAELVSQAVRSCWSKRSGKTGLTGPVHAAETAGRVGRPPGAREPAHRATPLHRTALGAVLAGDGAKLEIRDYGLRDLAAAHSPVPAREIAGKAPAVST